MRRRKRLTSAAAALVLLAAGTTGCAAETASGAAGPRAVAGVDTGLEVQEWGVLDTLVSAVVVNTTDHTLRYGQGFVRALGEDGAVLAESADGRGPCCAIVDLAPGASYGLYLDAGSSASQVTDVDVDIRNVSWAPADATGTDATDATGEVPAVARGIRSTSYGALVDAELRPREGGQHLLVQAFVADADGTFLGVVSGRWDCLPAGRSPIEMQLFHPVPGGARVSRVEAHAVTVQPDGPATVCGGSGRAG